MFGSRSFSLERGNGWNPRREKSVGDFGLRRDIEVFVVVCMRRK